MFRHILETSRTAAHSDRSSKSVISRVTRSCTSRSKSSVDTCFVGQFPKTSIMGYTGYIPGIRAEGYYGASRERLYKEANSDCAVRVDRSREYRRGLDVVGYTGFVPGKNASNVFGETFCRSNFTSQQLKRIESSLIGPGKREYVNKARLLFSDLRPSNSQGNYPMYAAQQRALLTANNTDH